MDALALFFRFARSLDARTYYRLEALPYSSWSRFQLSGALSSTSLSLRSSTSGRQRIIASLARSWSLTHFVTLARIPCGIGRAVPSGLRGVGSGSDPSTIASSLWSFNVAFVVTSQTLYESGLNSRREIFLCCALSSAMTTIVCVGRILESGRGSLRFVDGGFVSLEPEFIASDCWLRQAILRRLVFVQKCGFKTLGPVRSDLKTLRPLLECDFKTLWDFRTLCAV